MKTKCQIISLLLVSCVSLLLCNCSPVTTSYPLSSTPKAIDKEKFEGTWLIDDKGHTLQVKFDDNGIAQIAALEWKKDHFELGKMEMIIAEGNDHNFISIRSIDDGKPEDEYAFAQYTFSEHGELIIWSPNNDAFKEAIEKKLLQGTLKKNKYSTDIKITSDSTTLLKFLNDPSNSNLFDYKQPMVIPKIASPKKDE